MHTPTHALAWEFWRRHRKRLFLMAAGFLFFVAVYPALCVWAGLDLGATDFTDSVATWLPMKSGTAVTPLMMCRVFYMLFLMAGPATTMFMTLLCLIWMFTFTAPDPNTKDPLAFPLRLFLLPVSTPYLFWRFILGGQLAMVLCWAAWKYLVRLPQMEVFKAYESGFGWMMYMALMQGLVWTMAGWPNLRMVLIVAISFGFIIIPQENFPGSNFLHSPACLAALGTLGVTLGWMGLERMRHGQWQGWNWEQILAKFWTRGPMRGPGKFSSPEQAQLWFEWRRSSRRLCLYAALIGLTPVVAHILARVILFHNRPVDPNTLCAFAVCLLALPLFLHFCFIMQGNTPDLQFMLGRPLTNGQLMMATLKSSGISTVVSSGIAAIAIGGVACLGDIGRVNIIWKLQPHYWLAIIPAALLVTWRLTPANLCFIWSGRRRLLQTPAFGVIGLYLCAVFVGIFNSNEDYRAIFFRFITAVLIGLVILKFTLAAFSFRTSIKRGLLSRSAAGVYLAVWLLIASAVMLPVILIVQETTWIFHLCLLIVLLTPLFRVGLCPTTLAWNRHA
ncbi:MAG TPA: hypothetical protein VK742_14415 [Candidatus Sulfotelmatobacter sp.]|jgi:hypothetical protein|nr:hypothetical protein [Candidatus Sulfotelmatobacter sp.]